MASSLDPKRIEMLDDATVEKYRKMTPAERLAVGFELNRQHRRELADFFRGRHPDWSEERIQLEVGRTCLAESIANELPRDIHLFSSPND